MRGRGGIKHPNPAIINCGIKQPESRATGALLAVKVGKGASGFLQLQGVASQPWLNLLRLHSGACRVVKMCQDWIGVSEGMPQPARESLARIVHTIRIFEIMQES